MLFLCFCLYARSSQFSHSNSLRSMSSAVIFSGSSSSVAGSGVFVVVAVGITTFGLGWFRQINGSLLSTIEPAAEFWVS